ncbi:Bgt-1723 [Blumeria graminis f. sp. tritici]|uniref:Bgt-1723 n=1 Tax=Blumeria graminis f. sp. tritici TaxID=62690 RepID=A0A9X9MF43_BLUGR|nr:Bgt-1723 [Blumeria graminis f. sp. tritici]
MPQANAIIDTQSRAGCGSQDVLTIRTPFTDTWISAFNCTYLSIVFLQVINIHLTSQVSKPSDQHKPASWRKYDCVSRRQWKRVSGYSP